MLLQIKTINLIFLICLYFIISSTGVKAQLSHRVLFLGNSYTGVNNLPQLISDVALSTGDTLIFDSYTPGGYQLVDHSIDTISQNKIMAGNWNYVVIQGQSQEPITYTSQFYSGANVLYNLIKQYNACAVTMPYMTWGRKNGDTANCPFFPEMCTYQGMDLALKNSYLSLTEMLNGEVSPVSVVWNHLRQNNPGIELYQPDESHPSLAGSYAAACSFYTSIFKKDPTLITFDAGLSATDAAIIRDAVKVQVFDSLQIYDFKMLPESDFRFQSGTGSNELIFNPNNPWIKQTYFWDFGDGTNSSLPNPIHSYASNGTYIVSLTTSNCDLQGFHTSYSDTTIQFCSHTPTVFTIQPWLCYVDTLWTQPADSYQWYANGFLIPETNQYVSDYLNYGISGFSVMATINGCSELSQMYNDTPQWSGYYFDAIGDPCNGDTVAFAVLHTNGFLPGSQNILWYKNDTLLPLMTNEDTLLIFGSGKYECKVIDPNSNCPLDTTSTLIEYNCNVTGIEEEIQSAHWSVFPNPATETITVVFNNYLRSGNIQLYNAMGILIRSLPVSTPLMKINLADVRQGIYYIRLEGENYSTIKFVKQ